MSAVCWFEDRDDRLARARALAGWNPDAALLLVDSVLAEVADDVEALRSRADILAESGDAGGAQAALQRLLSVDASDARALIDLADLERDPAAALSLYERAIELLEGRGHPGDGDLAAARRGRERCLEERGAAR